VGLDGHGGRLLTRNRADSFPVWSPDGRQIAFLRAHANHYAVALMNADGTRQRLVAGAPRPVGRPSWSPDGRAIVVPTRGRSTASISARVASPGSQCASTCRSRAPCPRSPRTAAA